MLGNFMKGFYGMGEEKLTFLLIMSIKAWGWGEGLKALDARNVIFLDGSPFSIKIPKGKYLSSWFKHILFHSDLCSTEQVMSLCNSSMSKLALSAVDK